MPKQTILRPAGIITQPNEYGELAPGSLSVGSGIQIRRPSVIEPRNAFKTWWAPTLDIYKMWAVAGDQVIIIGPGSDYFTNVVDGTGPSNSLVLDGPDSLTEYTPGKTHLTEVRDRVIFTYQRYPVIWNPTDGTYNARQAGIAPLLISDITPTAGGNIWQATKYIGYAAVVRRTEADGYVVRGAVSSKLSAYSGADKLAVVRITWPSTAVLQANDIIELYRLPQQTSAGLLGAEYRLAVEYKLSAANLIAGYVDITDTCLETALANYLYTNPSQKGSGKTYNMPPPSSDVVTFKGATFYVATSVWHQVAVRIPNTWGGTLATTDEIAHGIGSRQTQGNFTNGQALFTVTDATGIKTGQIIHTTVTGLDNKIVTNVNGNIITASGPSGQTIGPGISVSFYDVIAIDGVSLDAHTPEALINALGAAMIAGTVDTWLHTSPTIDLNTYSVDGPMLTFMNVVPPNSFTIEATNGANYSPPLAEFDSAAQTSLDEPRTNRVYFSEIDQPENVPPDNRFLIGSGTILKLWATQDSLFAFCSDGIYRIDGDGDDWSVKPFDPDTILLSPDAVGSMDNQIYAFTTAGLISLTDTGAVKKISAPYIDEELRELWNVFTTVTNPLPYTWCVQLSCDKHRNEVWLNFNDYENPAVGHIKTWIWNVNTGTFVTQSDENAVAIVYAPFLRSILTAGIALPIKEYDADRWMATNVEFNSIYADDLGLLKQWIDVTMFLESLTEDALCTPRFEGEYYPAPYLIEAFYGAFDHVIAPLLTACHSKHLRFGYILEEPGDSLNPYYKLNGLTVRYRLASEALRQ